MRLARWAAIAIFAGFLVAACGLVKQGPTPRPIAGVGVLVLIHGFCLGVDLDGTRYGVDVWPDGLSVDPSGETVNDTQGRVVLRAGDRIELRGDLAPIKGDTSCAGEFYVTITEYTLLASSGAP